MGVQLNNSKFKSNDLTRMMPVTSEPFKTLQNQPKSKQPPCTLLRNRAYGTIRVAPDCLRQIVSAYSCKRSNHSQTHGYEPCRVDAVGVSSRPECRTDGTKENGSMPPPQPTDEVRRFFFDSFFFAPLSHTCNLMAYRHTRSPLGVVCMSVWRSTRSHPAIRPSHTAHTPPFIGGVCCLCVGLGHDAAGITHHTDLMRLCHASDNALILTNPVSCSQS